jgi:uncharacterized protein YndB with AHSA1/START domain
MRQVTTSHHTVIVRRSYDAAPRRVFAAWRSGEALQRWYVPGDGSWRCKILAHEFRVGGAKQLSFGAPGEVQFFEDCRYEDIVEDQRICFAMTISRGNQRITTSMVTVELEARGSGTSLSVTDQLVVLDGGDSSGDREHGWGETLDKLPAELARASA